MSKMARKSMALLMVISLMIAVFGELPMIAAAVDCTHEWEVINYDVETHTQRCSLCGTETVGSHSWGNYSLNDESGEWDVHNHHTSCTACGQVKVQAHNWVNGGNVLFFITTYTCAGCATNQIRRADVGYTVYGVDSNTSPDGCTHNWGVSAYDNNSHTLKCHTCNTTTTAAHVWDSGAESGNAIIYTCAGGCIKKVPLTADTASYPIEYHYTQTGPYTVSSIEYEYADGLNDTAGPWNHIKIWYPSEMETSGNTYPAIVFCNGSGSGYGPDYQGNDLTDMTGYTSLFEHFASWGFILVANNRGGSASSECTDLTLGFLLNKNETEGNLFYNKVDISKIGIAGHSQGGTGVLQNLSGATVTNNVNITYEYTNLYKAAWSASPQAYDNILQWTYTPENINTPVFMVCADDDWASSASILSTNMSKLADGVFAVSAVRNNTDHGGMVSIGKGYMIAWFRYILLGDSYAAEAFVGTNQELMNNANWSNQATKEPTETGN